MTCLQSGNLEVQKRILKNKEKWKTTRIWYGRFIEEQRSTPHYLHNDCEFFIAYSAFKRVVKIQSKWERTKEEKEGEGISLFPITFGNFFSNSTDLSMYWLVLVGEAEKHPDSRSRCTDSGTSPPHARTISFLRFYFYGFPVGSGLHHSILSNYCRHLTVCMSAAADKPFGLGTLILTNIWPSAFPSSLLTHTYTHAQTISLTPSCFPFCQIPKIRRYPFEIRGIFEGWNISGLAQSFHFSLWILARLINR